MIDKHSAIHKAWVSLKGDLRNSKHYDEVRDTHLYYDSEYYCMSGFMERRRGYVCTVEEFIQYCKNVQTETTPEDKQSGIHKAWVILNGNLQECECTFVDEGELSLMCCKTSIDEVSEGSYVVGAETTFMPKYWEKVCTVSEFENYCKIKQLELTQLERCYELIIPFNKCINQIADYLHVTTSGVDVAGHNTNLCATAEDIINGIEKKVKDAVVAGINRGGGVSNEDANARVAKHIDKLRPVFTKEMRTSGNKLTAGMKFSANGENYIAEVVNDKSVCFTDNAGYLATLPLEYVRPVLSETEKLSNLILSYINVCEGIDFCHHEDKLAEFLLCEGYRKLSPEELVVYDNK